MSDVADEFEIADPAASLDEEPTLGTRTELLTVCGVPGVGKSTVAAYLTDALDARRLRTDAIRKELFDEPTYADEESRTVYGTAFERARETLTRGRSVVLDGSFADEHHRTLAAEVARDCDVPFRLLNVRCPEREVVRRIEQRDDISDADVDVYYQMREEFDPLTREHIRVDNAGSWDRTVSRLENLVEESSVG